MYKTRTIESVCRVSSTSPIKRFSSSDQKFRKNSYFLRGGLDLSGEELKNDAKVSYDTEEELKQGAICAAALSNPKFGFMELAEAIGIENAEAELEKVETKNQDKETE